jgi:hypothetical protein
MFTEVRVYDLDGVLVDTSHRYRNLADGRIDIDYWMSNRTEENIAKDKPLFLVQQYRRDCENPKIYVIICTARVEHSLDRDFIASRLGMPNLLLMRPDGNKESDAMLKRRQLQRVFNLKQFSNLPRFFWDDNIINLNHCVDLFTAVFYVPSKQGI